MSMKQRQRRLGIGRQDDHQDVGVCLGQPIRRLAGWCQTPKPHNHAPEPLRTSCRRALTVALLLAMKNCITVLCSRPLTSATALLGAQLLELNHARISVAHRADLQDRRRAVSRLRRSGCFFLRFQFPQSFDELLGALGPGLFLIELEAAQRRRLGLRGSGVLGVTKGQVQASLVLTELQLGRLIGRDQKSHRLEIAWGQPCSRWGRPVFGPRPRSPRSGGWWWSRRRR